MNMTNQKKRLDLLPASIYRDKKNFGFKNFGGRTKNNHGKKERQHRHQSRHQKGPAKIRRHHRRPKKNEAHL